MKRLATPALAVVLALVVMVAPAAAATTGVISIHTDSADFNNGTLDNVGISSDGGDDYVGLTKFAVVDSFEDQDISEYTGDTASFDVTAGGTDGSYRLETVSNPSPMTSTSGLLNYYDRGDGNYTSDVYLNGAQDGIVIFGASGTDNHFDISLDGSADRVRIRKRDGGTTTTVTEKTGVTLPDDDWIKVTIDWDTDGSIFVKITNKTSGSVITTISGSDTFDAGDGVGWNGRDTGVYFDNGRVVGGSSSSNSDPGTYVSANHTAPNDVSKLFANLTVENATANVTWERATGGSWTEIATENYTTNGNKTFTVDESAGDYRVNVTFIPNATGEAEGRLYDEGIIGTVNAPQLSDPRPSGRQDTRTQTLKVNVSDADFSNDTVTVRFYVNGSQVGTDTLTSDGVASTSHSFTGTATWFANASDTYPSTENDTSNTLQISVPGYLKVYNESAPENLINDREVTATAYVSGEEKVVTRTASDGIFDLSGITPTSSLVIELEADDYHTVAYYLPDTQQNESAYMLPTNATAANVTFELQDNTGRYSPPENTTIYVERALNISDTTNYVVVASDTFGATGDKTFTLADGERYRLRVSSNAGESRVLGPYETNGDQVAVINIGKLTFSPTTSTVQYSTRYYNVTDSYAGSGIQRVVHFQYRDAENETDVLDVVIHEQGNESRVILDQTYDPQDPYGEFGVNVTVNGTNASRTWVVDFTAQRPGETDGDRSDTLIVAGSTKYTVTNPFASDWAGMMVVGLLGFVATIVGGVGAVAAFAVSAVAAVLWWTGFYPASGGVVVLAFGVAVLYKINEGSQR